MEKNDSRIHTSGKILPFIIFFAALLFGIAACSEIQSSSGEIIMEESYEITKGACGELMLLEKLADNYQKARQIIEEQKKEYYLSYCPDAPCNEIEIESFEIDVEDAEGKVPDITFTALQILDKQNGTHLESVHDVITSNGYHYQIKWCPD